MPGVTTSYIRAHRAPNAQKSPHMAGRIMWLPGSGYLDRNIDNDDSDDDDSDGDSDGDSDSDSESDDSTPEEGCYNHPVVILSNQTRKGKVVILILTSFNDTDLSTRHPSDIDVRLAYLPISPCPAHPDNTRLLTLDEQSQPLRKNSYVKTTTPYTVPYKWLAAYGGGGGGGRRGSLYFALSKTSYLELVEYVRYTVPLPNIGDVGVGLLTPPPSPPMTLRSKGFSLPSPDLTSASPEIYVAPAAASVLGAGKTGLPLLHSVHQSKQITVPAMARGAIPPIRAARHQDVTTVRPPINPYRGNFNYKCYQRSQDSSGEADWPSRYLPDWALYWYHTIAGWPTTHVLPSRTDFHESDLLEPPSWQMLLYLMPFFMLIVTLCSLLLYGMCCVTYTTIDCVRPLLVPVDHECPVIRSVP